MFKPEDVRQAFANGVFRRPAIAAAIAQVEQALGHALPDQLRSLYLAFEDFKDRLARTFSSRFLNGQP